MQWIWDCPKICRWWNIHKFCPIFMKLGENDYLMRWIFSLSFMRIRQEMWIFYYPSILEYKGRPLMVRVRYPNETWWKLLPHEVIIFTKFYEDWTKNVDFLLMANFWTWALFFTQTLFHLEVLPIFWWLSI